MVDEAEYNELARLLQADASALVPLAFPHNRAVSEAHIRMMAVILRRWLIDGDLQKLLTPLRLTALFNVQGNNLAQADAARTGAFRYYLTAGIKVDGRPLMHVYDSHLPEAGFDRSFMKEGRANLNLKKFLAQPRLLHNGHWFNTGQILRFVANKLGGNHLDFDRSGEWARLDAANDFMQYGGPILTEPPPGCELYMILEPNSCEIIGGVHLEVIAAAAAFIQLKIGNEKLIELATEKTLLRQLKKLFKHRAKISLVQRPIN